MAMNWNNFTSPPTSSSSLDSISPTTKMPLLPDNSFAQPSYLSTASPLMMPPPPPELLVQPGLSFHPSASASAHRPPDNAFMPSGQSVPAGRPASGLLPTPNVRSNGRATRSDRADQIKNAERAACSDVTAKIRARVQHVVEKLSQKLSDAELASTLLCRCLKCHNTLSTRDASNNEKYEERDRRSYEKDNFYLNDLFCAHCVSELCDVCWRFAKGKNRKAEQSDQDFRRCCQRSECSACLCRCWICSRHIEAEMRTSHQQQTTSVKDRIFNMCKNNVTADQSSRLSRQVYISSVKRIYDERKTTLTLFKKLTHCWKQYYLPYSQNHKLTDHQQLHNFAASWRSARCDLMMPSWLALLKKFETRMLPVISDGRAIDVYRHCLREKMLPTTEAKNGKCLFPRIPSSEEARNFFAGKRIVVMGDSIGRHVYRDLIHLLQGDGPLPTLVDFALRGDEQYANDICVYGAVTDFRLQSASNPAQKLTQKDWYEHRVFYGPRQITVEYVWVNKVWNEILKNDMKMLFDPTSYRKTYRLQRAPDVIIFNSALWDLTKYQEDQGYDPYHTNCAKFADLWKNIVSDVHLSSQQPAPMFICYSTPKPGLKVTGDLVRDMSKEDRQQIHCDRKVSDTRRFLYDALTRPKHAGASRIGFVDLYDATERLQLEVFRFADGIHYDPPALRVFTSLITAEYIRLSSDIHWPMLTPTSSSSSKRNADGVLMPPADDSVRLQWLNKCHDLVSAITMSYYTAQSEPVADIAHRELQNWLEANPYKREGLRTFDFFPIGAKMVKLWTVYPLPELPRIMSRLYAATAAMLNNMGRLMLIRHATSQNPTTLLPTNKAISWLTVADECRSQLRTDVSDIVKRTLKKPNMVHYGPLNGFYANEFFVRISCVMQILRYSEYAIPLYRFIRDSCDPSVQKRNRDDFAGGQFNADVDEKAILKHVETGEVQITVHASRTTLPRPLKERLLQEDEYLNGYDLAQLLYNKAKQPAISMSSMSRPLSTKNQQPVKSVASSKPQQQKSKGRSSQQQQQDQAELRPARPKFFKARVVNEDGEEEDVEELEEDTDDDEDDLDDDQYIIATIRDVRIHEESWSNDGLEYLVVWKKYPDEDTWEPIQNLDNCQELIDEFNAREGMAARKAALTAKRLEKEAKAARKAAARAARKAAGRDADIKTETKNVDVKPNLSTKSKNGNKFNDVRSMQAHFSGAKSSSTTTTRDVVKKSHKTIVKKKLDEKAAKKRRKIIESDDEADDKKPIKKEIKEKKKKHKKKDKKHHKRDKQRRKEEKEERRKKRKEKKSEKAENVVPAVLIAEPEKQQVEQQRLATQSSSVKVPDQQQRAARVYSAAWRESSVARGVREQRQLGSIVCLLPKLKERRPSNAAASATSSTSNLNDAELQKTTSYTEGFLRPLSPSAASSSKHAAGSAVKNHADRKRAPDGVTGALVMWRDSEEVEAVEIDFLLEYYSKQLLDAFLVFAKFSRKPTVAPQVAKPTAKK